MFNGGGLNISSDEILMNDMESLRQDIEAIGNTNNFDGKYKPSIPPLDFSKLKGSTSNQA